MALIPVAGDTLATIVTTLEMRTRPPLRPSPGSRLRLVQWERPALEKYRALFRRVGGPWLWYSRLAMDEERLRALESATLGELHQAGHLMPIFMALASLGNFTRLIARKNRILQHG